MQELEARLREQRTESSFPRLTKKGRPPRYTKEKYQWFLERTEEERQRIASENNAPIETVTDIRVARHLAMRSFIAKGQLNPPEYKLREMQDKYATFIKGFKKKRKSGEI